MKIVKFEEPINKKVKIEEEEYDITFIGFCNEKKMIWGALETEDGVIDLLIPASMLKITS